MKENKKKRKKRSIDLSGKVIKKYMWHVMQEWDLVLWEHLFLERKWKEAGFDDIEVKNVSIPSLPEDVDIVVTHKSLTDRAIAVRPNAIHYSVENSLRENNTIQS